MTQLAVLLPLATVAALSYWAACRWHAAGSPTAWRCGFLSALLIGASYVVLSSELLSGMALLSRGPIAAMWLFAATASAALARRDRRPAPPLRLVPSSWPERCLAALIAAVLSITAVTAWQSPPNTWDAMTYHMARVVHWAADGRLAFYPTHVPRQNLYLPGAELALLHMQLLSGGDRFAAFAAWLSFAGSLVATSVIAALLRCRASGQILAAALAATLPMAVIQASGTKNDLVVSLWLLCLTIGVLARRQSGGAVWILWTGASLGLALLTKVTAWVYAPPILGLALWPDGGAPRRSRLRPLAIAAALALLFNLPFLARYAEILVLAYTRSVPLSAVEKPDDSVAVRSLRRVMLDNERYLNARMNPAPLLANLVRNLGLHVTLPIVEANRSIEQAVQRLLARLGVADPDHDTTYPRGQRFVSPGWSTNEDDAPNPLHLVVFATALAICIARRRQRCGELRLWLCIVAAGFMFVLLLRWQPWHSRLHLPLFLLAAAPAAAVWSSYRRAWLPLAMVLGAAAVPALIASAPRALVGPEAIFGRARAELYFANRPALYADYAGVTAELDRRNCDDVGIIMHGNDWEYPLWALADPSRGRSFHHVCVGNPTSLKERERPRPCAVLLVEHAPTERIDCTGTSLPRLWSSPTIQLFAPS